MATALSLTALAVALAWPTPALLARARWTWRAPRAALVLWQAIGLAAGLAGIGAGLAVAVQPLDIGLLHGLVLLGHDLVDRRPFQDLHPVTIAGLIWALLLAGRLTVYVALSVTRVLRARARHRRLVDLVARPHPAAGGAHVLDHPAAVAYCLPGLRPRVVLSAGAMDLLSERELAAVLAHERAHARGRHDLVVLPFLALHATLPRVRWARRAHEAVSTLVEMHADDRACRRHEPRVLAAALARVGSTAVPTGALGATRSTVAARVGRLLDPAPAPAWIPAAAYLTAAVLVLLPTALLAAPVVTPLW